MNKAILLLAVLLAGCVSATRIDSGERVVGERLVFNLQGSWNQINAPGLGTALVWTMEGLPIDQLLVYSGIKDGEDLIANTVGGGGGGAAPATPPMTRFRASMRPDEIVGAFEGMFTRDGSAFVLAKLEPWAFAGGKGFRFEYTFTRKVDGAQLRGLGYGVVDRDTLFAMVYMAPRLTFFPRHQARVEQMASSAKLKI